MAYNYDHFKPEYYDFGSFDGPKPGDQAPDFKATDLDNEEVKLSDFAGKWIVLETGSLTCPITDSKVHVMDKLANQFDDVVFILLYTREAHPGETYHAHKSFGDKLECARKFASDYDVQRTVLVDDISGTVHQQFGSMPNSVHIINPEGLVVMRGDWANVQKVEKVLSDRDPDKTYEQEVYAGKPLFLTRKKGVVKVLKDAGSKAVWDFIKYAPILGLMHLRKHLKSGWRNFLKRFLGSKRASE